jgi:hypothetical protein
MINKVFCGCLGAERDKQYDEILEECQEFIDEIKLNLNEKKTVQEEVEEMEEVLDGLRRWLFSSEMIIIIIIHT